MDRDDPTRRPITQHFEDETFDEQQAAGGETPPTDDWQEPVAEEPIDDFADPEQAFAEEQVETNQGTELPSYAEEGPIEDDYAHEPLEQDEFVNEGEPSNARASAEEYLPRGMAEKKSSPIIKYAGYGVVAIVLVVAGFFGFQQIQGMMEASNNAPPEQPSAQAQQQPAPQENPAPVAQNNEPMPLGNQPPQQVANNNAAPPAPAPVPTTPAPGTVTRSGEYILQPDGSQTPIANAPAPVAQAPVALPPPATTSAQDNQIAMLNHQLDEMKKSQAQLEDQLRASQTAQQQQTPPSEVQAMKDKIAALEQKLSNPPPAPVVETKTVHKKTSVIAKPSNREEEDTAPVVEEKPAKSVRVKSSHSKTATSRTSGDTEASRLQREMNARYGIVSNNNAPSPSMGGAPSGNMGGPLPTGPASGKPAWAPQPSENPTMAVNAAGGSWILRSAQPGSAWLSQGMSSDLTRVVPGDKVPGLGTIVSVRMVAGHWLVEGTQGSVR